MKKKEIKKLTKSEIIKNIDKLKKEVKNRKNNNYLFNN